MNADHLLEMMEDIIEDDMTSLNEKCKKAKKSKATPKKKVSESAEEIIRLLNSLR